MGRYYSTFITGFGEVVKEAFLNNIENINIILLLDGLIIYETEEPYQKLVNQRYLNNTFCLLNLQVNNEDSSLSHFLTKIIYDWRLLSPVPKEILKEFKSFRVITSNENEIVKVDKEILEMAECMLLKKLGLTLDKAKPDTEVWFLKRQEGHLIVGLRLTKKPNYENVLHKGELRPELSTIMCLVADLKPKDIVLDPFAGYGSIPLECARSFKVKKIFAGENDKKVFKILAEKAREYKSSLIVGRWNGLNLTSLTDNSIDRIITDPPWGFYRSSNIDIEDFYNNMFKEFQRLLRSKGIIVLISSQTQLIEKLIKTSRVYKLVEKYNTLVSGKKASVYKILCK